MPFNRSYLTGGLLTWVLLAAVCGPAWAQEDTTPPTFEGITANPSAARAGTPVEINFSASEPLQADPEVYVNYTAATLVSADGLQYVFQYVVLASDIEGAAIIEILGTDLAGNPGDTTTTTALTLDLSAPYFHSVSASPSVARAGTLTEITFWASEALAANPVLTVNGRPATRTGGFNTFYRYRYAVQAEDPDGPASLLIEGQDLVGNMGQTSVTTALGIDNTPPTIQDVAASPPRGKTGASILVTFLVLDPLSGSPQVTVNDHAATYLASTAGHYTYLYTVQTADPDGPATIRVAGTDAVGNTGAITSSEALEIDRVMPVFSAFTALPSTAREAVPVLLGFTASEALRSDPSLTVNGHPATLFAHDGLDYHFTYTVQPNDPDGIASLRVSGIDIAGNLGTTLDTATLTVDKLAPAASATPLVTRDITPPLAGTVEEADATVQVTVNAQTLPAVNNGDGTWNLADDLLSPLPEGIYDVQVQAVDLAGNVGLDATNGELTIDLSGPVIQLAGVAAEATEATYPYVDAGASAVDNFDPAVHVSVTGFVDTGLLGDYLLTFSAQDAAGNEAVPVTRTVHVVDTTPPGIVVVGDNPLTLRRGAPYTDPGATASDRYDGELSAQVVTTGLPIDTSQVGEFILYYNVSDSSGNPALERTRTVVVVLAFHSADMDLDSVINLSELLRVIQLFNLHAYHCLPGSEDGYAPGTGDQFCPPHDLDYNPQDWSIDLSELLRVVQFFNVGSYHACPAEGTEDGYCPGP